MVVFLLRLLLRLQEGLDLVRVKGREGDKQGYTRHSSPSLIRSLAGGENRVHFGFVFLVCISGSSNTNETFVKGRVWTDDGSQN